MGSGRFWSKPVDSWPSSYFPPGSTTVVRQQPDDEDWTLFAQGLSPSSVCTASTKPVCGGSGQAVFGWPRWHGCTSFAFVDHALRHGDSLVGLSREQVASFHWQPSQQIPLLRTCLDRALSDAESLRKQIKRSPIAMTMPTRFSCTNKQARRSMRSGCTQTAWSAASLAAITTSSASCCKDWESKVAECLAGRGSLQALRDFVTELREPSTGQRPGSCLPLAARVSRGLQPSQSRLRRLRGEIRRLPERTT